MRTVQEPAPSRRLCLLGELEGAEVVLPLDRGPNLVGSDAASQVWLPHDGVSRRHALLVLQAGELELFDHGSKNGTFVNGRRVRSTGVELGDRIAFGPLELTLGESEEADLLLAVDLAPTPAPDSAGVGRPGGETPTAARLGSEPLAALWLRLAARFVEQLRSAAGGPGSALVALLEALGARGACLAGPDDEGGLTVLAACGDLDSELLLTDLPSAVGGHGPARFHSSPALTFLAAGGPEGVLALAVSGDFPNRTAAQPLFEALLGLFLACRGPESDPQPRSRAERAAELRFPPGYVPGTSEAMRAFHLQLAPLAAGELPLLIQGETGAGKEAVARTVHLSSPRREGPFVAINCAAIPADLLEAELFGIRRGVATGVEARPGKFQEAGGGTLLLDEIGEMPPNFQSKLLRVLQEKVAAPLGGAPEATDVRVLAATNADLGARMADGSFRRDLYFRIAGHILEIPPLRRRPEDIPLLVDRMLRTLSAELNRPVRGMSLAALTMLRRYSWPGNVRELEHELRRLVTLNPPGQAIRSGALSPQIQRGATAEGHGTGPPLGAPAAAASPDPGLPTLELAQLQARAVREALERCEGNRTRAARLLGISRYALLRKLRSLED